MAESLLIVHAAQELGVSKRTIYNYVREGKLETVRIGLGQRILVRSIRALQRQVVANRAEAAARLEQQLRARRG